MFYEAECISDLFTKWEIILFLLSKCIIWNTRNAKIEVESLFTEQTCIGFVPKVSTWRSFGVINQLGNSPF